MVEGADLCLSLACAHGGGTTFDSSFEFPAAPAYQRASALSCFRFVDNAMHFSLPEIGRLLHALPVQPAQRRLFFSAHVACRRRLAKRWQETSLAKLFTLDDEFALLFQRSLQSYLRGRIQSLGLSPHDAFAAFDTDSNGMLDMPELYAAFEYLEVPQLAPADVLCFARALSDKGAVPQVKYEVWLEIMSQTSSLAGRAAPASSGGDAIEGGVDAGTGVTGAVGAPHPDGDVPITDASRPAVANALAVAGDPHVRFALKPKCAEELLELLRSTTLAERAVEEQLEATQASAVAAAQAIAEEAAKVVDFSFLRKLRDASHSAGANPFISSSTCFYDLAARDSHQPVGVVGRLLRDLNGPAHTPCVVLPPSSHQVYRVPWRRNGGGANLNCYQISLMIKLQEPNYHRNHTLPLISASGFDSWSTITKSGAGLANGPVTLGLVDGRMAISNGMEQVIATGKQSVVQAGKWTVVSWNVDANAGTVRCFLNGTAATDTISVDWLKRSCSNVDWLRCSSEVTEATSASHSPPPPVRTGHPPSCAGAAPLTPPDRFTPRAFLFQSSIVLLSRLPDPQVAVSSVARLGIVAPARGRDNLTLRLPHVSSRWRGTYEGQLVVGTYSIDGEFFT